MRSMFFNLNRREEGISMVVLAIAMVPILAVVGLVIDGALLARSKATLQAALDTAASGAANLLLQNYTEAEVTEYARRVAYENLRLMGTSLEELPTEECIEVGFENDTLNRQVKVSISAPVTLAHTFIKVLPGIGDSTTLTAISSAIAKRHNHEPVSVTLLIDVSRSMSRDMDGSPAGSPTFVASRIERTKQVSNDLVDSLQPGDQVSLIVFSTDIVDLGDGLVTPVCGPGGLGPNERSLGVHRIDNDAITLVQMSEIINAGNHAEIVQNLKTKIAGLRNPEPELCGLTYCSAARIQDCPPGSYHAGSAISYGGTSIMAGLRKAKDEFTSSLIPSDPSRKKMLVLLSDGAPDIDSYNFPGEHTPTAVVCGGITPVPEDPTADELKAWIAQALFEQYRLNQNWTLFEAQKILEEGVNIHAVVIGALDTDNSSSYQSATLHAGKSIPMARLANDQDLMRNPIIAYPGTPASGYPWDFQPHCSLLRSDADLATLPRGKAYFVDTVNELMEAFQRVFNPHGQIRLVHQPVSGFVAKSSCGDGGTLGGGGGAIESPPEEDVAETADESGGDDSGEGGADDYAALPPPLATPDPTPNPGSIFAPKTSTSPTPIPTSFEEQGQGLVEFIQKLEDL
jgi:Flp pilus assembly protein TadG